MDLYKFYINHDPVMTLTYFTARSTKVANAFEWGKLVNVIKWGKITGSVQMDFRLVFMKTFCPQEVVCPCPGLKTCI